MGRQTGWLAALIALLGLCSCSDDPVGPRDARILTVDPYEGTGYLTVQDALNASVDGDIIELVNGRHSGPGNRDLDFGGRSIVLRSKSGKALHCILDADGYYLQAPEPHFNLRFRLREPFGKPLGPAPTVRIENLRIEDGFESVQCDSGTAPVFRGCTFERSYRAVVSTGASPVFVNCSFDNNDGGALICEQGSSVLVQGGRVWQNYSPGNGAGIAVRGSKLTVSDCDFIRNVTTHLGAAIYSDADEHGNRSRVMVIGSWFHYQAWNGAVWLAETDFDFVNCVFSDNEASMSVHERSRGLFMGCVFRGEGIYLDSGSSARIESCIIAYNTGPGVNCGWDGTARVEMYCTDLFENDEDCLLDQIGENGNMSVDPMFCYFVEGDFALYPESPVALNCWRPYGWPLGCRPVVSADAAPGR